MSSVDSNQSSGRKSVAQNFQWLPCVCFSDMALRQRQKRNTSKSWNKHNSFLFVAAGLSHEYIHLEYNVHFLSTSNITDPLEMAEAVVDQIL